MLARGRAPRWAVTLLCALLGVLVCLDSIAETAVPLALQVRLLARLGPYDRNFKSRAGAAVNVLVVRRKGDEESAFEQASLLRVLADVRDIGGLPVHVAEVELSDADALARRCRAEHISVLYLTHGLEEDTPRLTAALANGDILTVGTSARHAENGAVVGFALEEARPRLVINLPRARAQNVDFRAEVLALARLIQ
jgi:YfiR/HmsC-like